MKSSINVIVPVELDASDPSVEVSLKIQVQNFGQLPETAISVVDSNGNLRPFSAIQREYAQRAVAIMGSASAAEKGTGLSRQTITKYLTE